jgi:hypothetical protein
MTITDHDIERLDSAPRIVKIQAIAAAQARSEEQTRHQKIRELALGNSRGTRLGEVITLLRTDPNPTDENAPTDDISRDAYVVEVIGYDESLWTGVVNGKRTGMHFLNRYQAILDAIAQIHGGGDDHATASLYAARVLNINLND